MGGVRHTSGSCIVDKNNKNNGYDNDMIAIDGTIDDGAATAIASDDDNDTGSAGAATDENVHYSDGKREGEGEGNVESEGEGEGNVESDHSSIMCRICRVSVCRISVCTMGRVSVCRVSVCTMCRVSV